MHQARDDRPMVAGILLTGGASRRMGTDKATLVVDGETLAHRAARTLALVCDPVLEVGTGATDLPVVREDPPGGGPLAALVAGADALGAAPVLLLACDMPFVDEALLRFLADRPGPGSVVAMADDRPQFGCARYGRETIDRARTALANGERSFARALADDPTIEHVPPAAWLAVARPHAFADLDTPEDLDRLGPGTRR
jgi:molybdopterin-guanine dinucleotide biosynthesis protein A